MNSIKPTLLYFGDPMCSWCYGFAPQLKKTIDSLKTKFDFKLVMGGLRPYNTQTMDELGDFLKHHWEQVAEVSGQKFNFALLEDTTFVYDTEPPARAVVTMRHLDQTREYDFYELIQSSFYAENLNTNKVDTYLNLLESFHISKDDFKKKFESDEMKQAVKADFDYSKSIGVRGFPTVLLSHEDQLHMISNGYTQANTLIERINPYLSAIK